MLLQTLMTFFLKWNMKGEVWQIGIFYFPYNESRLWLMAVKLQKAPYACQKDKNVLDKVLKSNQVLDFKFRNPNILLQEMYKYFF